MFWLCSLAGNAAKVDLEPESGSDSIRLTWSRCESICGFFCNLPIHLPANMLEAMRALSILISFALSSSVAVGQASAPAPAFDVASVKPSQHLVGPDYNNQLSYLPTGIIAKNVTLKRLIAEAYHLQLNQVLGPSWLDKNEYDIEARSAGVGTREQMALMLRSLVAERFKLTEHSEMREMRVYELVIGKSGPKIRPISDGETATAASRISFSRGFAPVRGPACRPVIHTGSRQSSRTG